VDHLSPKRKNSAPGFRANNSNRLVVVGGLGEAVTRLLSRCQRGGLRFADPLYVLRVGDGPVLSSRSCTAVEGAGLFLGPMSAGSLLIR
jgi:hypothetical protein